MISKDNKICKLIEIYFYVCKKFEEDLKNYCERMSNNNKPEFTDEEMMCVYIYGISQEQRFKVKQIYEFADEHLRSWFPKLPSYSAFDNRLNKLSEAFAQMIGHLIKEFMPKDCIKGTSILDSMPIITCSGRRKGKVAESITDKGYCSTKGIYYYGIKVHALGFRRENHMPFPEEILITSASENDLNVFKNSWSNIGNRTFYGDKIYLIKIIFQSWQIQIIQLC